MALGTPVAAAAAYSASAGTTVAPAYPAGILTTDAVLLFVGMKPAAVGGGTVTTPSGWTLQDSLINAGGYTAQGADTGNSNLYVYTWNTPVAGQTGSLTVTIGGNNVTWAFMVRVPTGGGALIYGSADGQRTTTPTSPMSIALTNGATATNFQTGDKAIWAMCIPTDVTTPSQFSAQSITATGATFGTATEFNEPDSTTGNDIGGYSAWAHVTAGSSTTAPTVTATLAGTLTNVRGPVVLLRVREAAVTHATTGTLTGQIGEISGVAQHNILHDTSGDLSGQTATITGAADHVAGGVTHDTSGTLTGQGSAVAGAAARTRQHATTGVLTGPSSTVAGSSARFRAFATSGTLIGQDSTVTGSAARVGGPVTHATTGTLSGQGTTLAGVATRFRAHATDGTLLGQTATLTGTARHNVPHATSGTLVGQGTTLAGSATRSREHAASGVLDGPGAIIVGSALRIGAPITHDTSGALIGQQSIIVGDATLIDPPRGGGGPGNAQAVVRNRRRGWANERAQFELSQEIQTAQQTLEQSPNKIAQRIAKKVKDYSQEVAQLEQLQKDFAKLQAEHESKSEMDAELREAAQVMQQFLQDEQDIVDLLLVLDDFDAKCVIAATTEPFNSVRLIG